MRILFSLLFILLLGACNRVHSDQPLFFAGGAPDAPRLRDGLWVIESGDEPCRFDRARPVTRWPDCADWMLVRGGEILGYDAPGKGDVTGVGEWTSIPYVLAPGAPLILQLAMREDGKVDYQYFGLDRIAGVDQDIAAFAIWPVQCGAPPPPAPQGEKPRYVTLTPLPGMILKDDGCTTDSADAVRAAAGPSRAWTEDSGKARWVRAGYP
ncbi:MAG: hypothetical protein Q7U20_03750 [Caulobacter sp.]|nr:hypothetical protein [Caulobacter sp.]